ncbi:hypothetical protein HOK00_00420 [bacterium]|jgi:hypothetical protein|nr:hypothetical protein [bacterium]
MKEINIFKIFETKILKIFSLFFELIYDNYIKIRLYPKYKATISVSHYDYSDFAIILQGPYIKNFTDETIEMYLKMFKNAKIIISCWKADEENISKNINNNVIYIFSKKPLVLGNANINLQITTTINAVKKAKEIKSKFILKTRTDQRYYKIDLLNILKNLLDIYPIENSSLESRLIVSSYNTFKYRLYGISDMLMFGKINDIYLYWDAKDRREIIKSKSKLTLKEFSLLKTSEVFLCTKFLEKLSYKIDWTLDNSWESYNKFFIVLNKEEFQMYWYKYNRYMEDRFTIVGKDCNSVEYTFMDWLQYKNSKISILPKDRKFLNSVFMSEESNE